MTHALIESYFLLLRVDIALRLLGFKNVYETVRKRLPRRVVEAQRTPHEQLCHAMNLASVFYPKRVACFQRSIASVLLLRRYGWPVEFVNGCDISTFENHAWVELSQAVINDKPYINEIYQVLDRC
jgi:Transglutaminase-like superfamily